MWNSKIYLQLKSIKLLRVTRNEHTDEGFFLSNTRDFKQRYISETIDFFLYVLWNKRNIIFDHIIDFRDDPARADPEGHDTFWRAISHSVEKYIKLEMLKELWNRFRYCCVKIKQ